MARVLLIAALLVCVPAARSSAAPLTLDLSQPGAATAVRAGANAVVVGDTDGNGSPDTADFTYLGRTPGCFRARVLLRSGTSWAPQGSWTIADSGNHCLRSIWPAGDVNGDGRADLLLATYVLGARGHTTPDAFVVFGQSRGAQVDIAKLGSAGFRIHDSKTASTTLGEPSHVEGGDFNGDGYADVLINSELGSARIVFGKPDSAPVDLSSGDNVSFTFPVDEGLLRAAFVSDMNGDGRAEVAFGLGGSPSTDPHLGTWVVFGRPGNGTIAVGSDPSEFWIDVSGFPAGIGDANGDGRGDLAVDDAVVFGKPDTAPVRTSHGAPFAGFTVTDSSDGELCSPDVADAPAPAGDVNGDGKADVIIGCSVVLAQPAGAVVDLATPSAATFVIGGRGVQPDTFTALGDVTGDGRPDFFIPDASLFVRGPDLLTTPNPVSFSGGQTDPVQILCLLGAGCHGDVKLTSSGDQACGGHSATRASVLASGTFSAAANELAGARLAVAPGVQPVARCLLGLAVRESATTDAATSQQKTELIPPDLLSPRAWTTSASRTPFRSADYVDSPFMWLDPTGTQFGMFQGGKTSYLWNVPASSRARRTGLAGGAAARWSARTVIFAGSPPNSSSSAFYGFTAPDGRLGRVHALDPRHKLGPGVSLGANGHGTAVAVVDGGNPGRGPTELEARFITRAGAGPLSPPFRHSGAASGGDVAVNGHGDAMVAWCSDPSVAITSARSRGRFARPQLLPDNSDSGCGWSAAATGSGRRFAWLWTTWYDPYDDEGITYPTVAQVATGIAGGRFRVRQIDTTTNFFTQNLPVALAFDGRHLLAGFTHLDVLSDRLRAVVEDVTTGQRRWISPPTEDASFGNLAVRGDGAVVAVWSAFDSDSGDSHGVFANFARHPLAFGLPEQIEKPQSAVSVTPQPAIDFDRSGRAHVFWFDKPARAGTRLIHARRS